MLFRFLSSLPESKCSAKCLRENTSSLFNSIIRASIEKGSHQKALLDYKTLLLLGNFRPDHKMLAHVLEACKISSNIEAAMEAHGRVIKSGLESYGSMAILFQMYLDHEHLAEAHQLFDGMLKWDSDPVPGNLMIVGLLRNGEFEKAKRVFEEMSIRDLVSWNSMISGYVKCLRPKEAICLFQRMLSFGFEPDGFAFSSVLSACARVGALAKGEWVHRMMAEKAIKFNYILGAALIDMYSKCGRIDVAKKIFEAISREDVSVWNSMITGLAIHGLGSEVIELFSRMEEEGVTPDRITFVGILTACSHCGLVEEGHHYFDLMKQKYSIEPRIEHYGAMVDLLARAGHLEEAYETIKAMPMEPDTVIWRVLLSACRRHRHPDLGEVAIKQMAHRDSGDYVLLSSIYSSAKRWSCAEKVWEKMKESRIRKDRGLSWVELSGGLHQFKAGDRSHPESDGIYRVLDGLMRRLRADGLVPMTELVGMDVLEEEKEANLYCHSEKLAVAYSILKTVPGMEIRVSKNLQTCGDCHCWLKMVSKALCRVIVVRDRARFHRFERGSCSCRDYW